jgi:hypothetical protein
MRRENIVIFQTVVKYIKNVSIKSGRNEKLRYYLEEVDPTKDSMLC